MAVNEVGRKSCDECGDNSDWDLHIESEEERESRQSSLSAAYQGRRLAECQHIAGSTPAGATNVIDIEE